MQLDTAIGCIILFQVFRSLESMYFHFHIALGRFTHLKIRISQVSKINFSAKIKVIWQMRFAVLLK